MEFEDLPKNLVERVVKEESKDKGKDLLTDYLKANDPYYQSLLFLEKQANDVRTTYSRFLAKQDAFVNSIQAEAFFGSINETREFEISEIPNQVYKPQMDEASDKFIKELGIYAKEARKIPRLLLEYTALSQRRNLSEMERFEIITKKVPVLMDKYVEDLLDYIYEA